MKLSITPVALAVTMALGAAVAQAQTPTYGTTSPDDSGKADGLYLAVWDNSTGYTDLVDLTSLESQVTAASGTLTTPTPGSNGWTQVSNFDGYATVDQLDLGTVSNFASLFPTSTQSASTQYGVYAANNTGTDVEATIAVGTASTVTESAVKTLQGAIGGEVAEWFSASNTSPLGDTTNKQAYSIPSGNGSLGDGNLGLTGDSFSNAVGTAENFYDYVVSSGRPATLTTTEYSYQGTDGFWFLSSTGDLSWNLVTTASTVPLPPAVWLFASGLIGLGLIGRRRQTGLGTAV
jgi:hypothetical protein